VPKGSSRKTSYWLHLIPIETKEVLLLAAPASGPGGELTSAKYTSFEPLRLLLAATTNVQASVLDEAAKALKGANHTESTTSSSQTNNSVAWDCLPEISTQIVFNDVPSRPASCA
jgi:hypothetical protein